MFGVFFLLIQVVYNKENLERRETNKNGRGTERHLPIQEYSTAEEGHCDLAEIFIFVSFHLYMS